VTLPGPGRLRYVITRPRPYDRAVDVAALLAGALLGGIVVGLLVWRVLPADRRPGGPASRPARGAADVAAAPIALDRPAPGRPTLVAGSVAGPTASVSAPAPPAPAAPELARRVLEVMAPGALVIDPTGQVVLANPAARAMGVLRAGRLVVEELRRLVREARRDGEPRFLVVDTPGGRLGREPLAVSAHVTPLDETGYVALLLDDVTESRRLAAVRRDFVANVSHELKTPVGALTLLAEAVQDAADDPVAVTRFAARMQHEGSRLGRLVQELIELSRLQGADPLPQPAIVEVETVVTEALDRSRLAAESAGITVVSGGERGLTVRGSESQLITALGNLVDNAIVYSASGTRVAVGTRQRDGYVEIAVSDQGIGIAERDLERVFERFYRADPARSRATGGTGLGLAIVKHIATNHGGGVSVWSVEGSGSTFTLRLPVATPWPVVPEPELARPELARPELARSDVGRSDFARSDIAEAAEPEAAESAELRPATVDLRGTA
jgi:two-component system, OmpR family, sensor histidine kinase SenX3